MTTSVLLVRADAVPGPYPAPANPHPGEPWEVAEVLPAEAADRLRGARPDALVLVRSGVGPDGLRGLADAATAAGVPVLCRPADGAEDGAALALELAGLLERRQINDRLAQLARIGGDDFVAEMLELGLENLPEQLGQAAAAAAAGDWATVARHMHSLSSSAGNYGLRAVQSLAKAAELRAAGGLDAAELVTQAAAAFARARPHLEARRGGVEA